jgi:DNA-binding Xre family transcriptional regulator
MKLRIKEICEAQGIKSAYELAKRTNLKMPTAYRAFANDIKQFTPQTLKALCDALKCSPNHIFGYDEPQRAKPQSPNPDAEKPASQPETPQTTASVEGMLSTVEVAKRLGLSRKSVNDYINKKLLLATKGKGNHNFVSEADLEKFIENR